MSGLGAPGVSDPLESHDSDGSEDSSHDAESDASSSLRDKTTFTLEGASFKFENPVVLVLAAARQLGMAIGRDARLLWIADEALLDEYEEEEALALSTVHDKPLSDEVAQHYGAIFAERSCSCRQLDSDTAESAASASSEIAEAVARRARLVSQKEARAQGRKERWRRRLALREVRLSHVSERYTDEQVALDETSPPKSDRSSGSSSENSQVGSHTAQAAVWPNDLARGSYRSRLSLGGLPRIDSSSIALDQLEAAALAAVPGHIGQSELPADAASLPAPEAPMDPTALPATLPTCREGSEHGAVAEAVAELAASAEASGAAGADGGIGAGGGAPISSRECAPAAAPAALVATSGPFALGSRVEVQPRSIASDGKRCVPEARVADIP